MNVTIIPVGMLGTNCYLLSSQKGSCVVVDPGANPDKIAAVIAEKGYTLHSILLTHGHWDHTGGVKKLLEKFPGVHCYIGSGDKELLTDQEKAAMIRPVEWEEYHLPDVQTLEDGAKIELDELVIRVMSTPGHSLGSVCYICGDAIFAGDTLFYENVGRCDLYGGSFESLKASLSNLAELVGEHTVYPGHGEITSLQHEKKHNPYMHG